MYNGSPITSGTNLGSVVGVDYDFSTNTLTIDGITAGNTYDSSKDFYLMLNKTIPNNMLILQIKGNVSLKNDYMIPVNGSDKKIYVDFVDNTSSLTLNGNGNSAYTGDNPIYKYEALKNYGKDIAYDTGFTYKPLQSGYYLDTTLQTSITLNVHEADLSNIKEFDGNLIKRTYYLGTEDGSEEFEAVKGFIVDTDAIKEIDYANDIYTLTLKDYGDTSLYIELLFKDTEVFNTIEREFVSSDLSSVVPSPTTTYDIEDIKEISGTMYKDGLGNYYYSYYITMHLNTGITEYEDFAMRFTGKDSSKHKYINVKFTKTPTPPVTTPEDNDDDTPKYIYHVPNTAVR